MKIDVQDLDASFTFAGLKDGWSTGIGVLYGKYLEQMSPVGGGEMIDFVYEQSASWKKLPLEI